MNLAKPRVIPRVGALRELWSGPAEYPLKSVPSPGKRTKTVEIPTAIRKPRSSIVLVEGTAPSLVSPRHTPAVSVRITEHMLGKRWHTLADVCNNLHFNASVVLQQ